RPARAPADAAPPERGEVLHGDLAAGDVIDAHRGAALIGVALDQHHGGAAAADRLDERAGAAGGGQQDPAHPLLLEEGEVEPFALLAMAGAAGDHHQLGILGGRLDPAHELAVVWVAGVEYDGVDGAVLAEIEL